MRERWDELLSLLVAYCQHSDAAKWANEIEAAVSAKNAEIAKMRAALAKAERVLCGWDCVEDSPEEREALRVVRAALGMTKGAEQ